MTEAAKDGSPAGLILLLCGQRSGSNHFLDLLEGRPGLMPLSEVFNPRAVYVFEAAPQLAAALEARHGGPDGVHRAFRLRPEAAIADLRSAAGPGAHVLVKVCPAQLHGNALRRILAQQAEGAILLTRRRLDQYVSFVKALQSGRWQNQDTTALRPWIGVELFLAWAAGHDRWLADVAALCTETGTPLARIDYDRDLDLPDPALVARRLEARLAGLPLPLPARAEGELRVERFRRQDMTGDVFGRIANGAALRTELEALGLLDYALSSQAEGALDAGTGGAPGVTAP